MATTAARGAHTRGDIAARRRRLLLPGEVRLAAGETYTSPSVFGAYGIGLDAVTARFPPVPASRPHHPRNAAAVTLNTWEPCTRPEPRPESALAEAAADVGAERFVVDDGWFRHRRRDNAGLGDWYVDETVWPDGLHPLVERVRKVGLQFGLWVEPEMVNPDSDLARSHPEWIMATANRLPPEARQQQVLDLAHTHAYDYILERLDALVTEYGIDYLKWDHNRDLVEAGHSPHGAAGVHEQTLAVYRLIDELRARHPHWRSSPALWRGVSTSASSIGRTGSGRRTVSTRWSGNTSSAGPHCSSRRR